jgi:hypothetical protein
MHHFVKKRVLGFLPPVAANMAFTDDYLGWTSFLAFPRIVAEPALESA